MHQLPEGAPALIDIGEKLQVRTSEGTGGRRFQLRPRLENRNTDTLNIPFDYQAMCLFPHYSEYALFAMAFYAPVIPFSEASESSDPSDSSDSSDPSDSSDFFDLSRLIPPRAPTPSLT